MKYGVRKPNVKKSIKARTTGKVKRQVKKAVNPLYGKKGMGIVNDPKKAAYNAVYSRTTVGVSDAMKSASSGNGHTSASYDAPAPVKKEYSDRTYPCCNTNRLCGISYLMPCKKHFDRIRILFHSTIKPCFLHWFYFLYSFLGW